ncbi:MAG TPA: carboxy terminal-processing peptidase [Flavobacterium sp.]|nr:carboxy terminal-processing peptidase [Flavobacterium sp.]
MNKNYRILLFVAFLAAASCSFMAKKNTPNPEKESLLMELISFIIQNGHYHPADVNDDFSAKVYTNYLDALDGSKRFFLQEDIDAMSQFEYQIDDLIKDKSFSFFDMSYNLHQKRMKEVQGFYEEILDKPFDFSIDESIDTDYENQPYVKTLDELKDRWRIQLKYTVLSSINNKLSIQKELDDDDKDKNKTFEEIEKESRESAKKSLDEFFDAMLDISREEWLGIYLNCIVEQFDPHTNYLSPENQEKFDESMSGSMEGIGATLRKKDDYVEITEVLPGGPAWRGKELENGDLVLKVAQGNEDPVDIAGMRLTKVVKMIKGKKGTEVKLTVKKVDGSVKIISIIRDRFEIEETFAKSTIIETENGKYGLINLPKFYVSDESNNHRNAFTDVAKEVKLLKEQNVDGIVMDLRNNGGGSLKTVVDMVGLFVENGPVVQVKNSRGESQALESYGIKTIWTGPLVVLVNNYSASASEIFAAAIQDYNRGLILGSKHTFGKGTVQNYFALNDLIQNNEVDLGALKFTSQKFYRINGGSTQLKGVESDIILPDRFLYIDTGERDYDNAMPWDKINPASYEKLPHHFEQVVAESKKRVENNENFKLIDSNAQWISERQDEKVFSLNMDKFKQEAEKTEEKAKEYESLKDYKNSLVFKSLPSEVSLFEQDTVLKSKREVWHENMQEDVYIEEAIHVLHDLKNAS